MVSIFGRSEWKGSLGGGMEGGSGRVVMNLGCVLDRGVREQINFPRCSSISCHFPVIFRLFSLGNAREMNVGYVMMLPFFRSIFRVGL